MISDGEFRFNDMFVDYTYCLSEESFLMFNSFYGVDFGLYGLRGGMSECVYEGGNVVDIGMEATSSFHTEIHVDCFYMQHLLDENGFASDFVTLDTGLFYNYKSFWDSVVGSDVITLDSAVKGEKKDNKKFLEYSWFDYLVYNSVVFNPFLKGLK